MHTAIIANSHAGALRRDPGLADRMRTLCGDEATLHLTRDLDELRAAAEATARDGVTTVGLVGGDGTASAVLTALWRAYGERPLPSIVFLRGGTMNTIAGSLGITRGGPLALLHRALEAARTPGTIPVRARPAIRIGDRLGFLFGTGVWYGYLHESYADGQPTYVTNLSVLARALSSAAVDGDTYRRIFQAHALSVRFADGAWEPRKYLTVAAGTIADAGFGFRPFHRAFTSQHRFQLFAIHGGATDVLRDLPGLWVGRGLSASTAHDTVTPWAELRSHDGPFGYAVDGDLCTAQETLRLSLGPVFRFLCI
ncbi:MAG: diacylglycerol kinase family protein [Polyangiales bacterium]